MKYSKKLDTECGWFAAGSQALGFAVGMALTKWHETDWTTIVVFFFIWIVCLARSSYCKLRDDAHPDWKEEDGE